MYSREMMTIQEMKDYIVLVCKPLVDNPRSISIIDTPGEDNSIIFTLYAENAGQLIGLEGRIAQALRTIIKSVARAQSLPRLYIEIEGLDVDARKH